MKFSYFYIVASHCRHLLSCDTNQDVMEWQSKLNHVVSALREWSINACENF